jgi:AraC family transcriptional regulator of adaptative response/methylated-DNA-[protein]-cysteine methyltransferase
MLAAMDSTAPGVDSREYARIARAIEYIREHGRSQPGPAEVADAVHLSAPHFTRLFHRWAGIPPKQFLQRLTLDAAKSALADDANVFDAALEAGLSGPGRLHDLFVALEAATPGDFRARGAGLQIVHAPVETPFGLARLASTPRGIAFLGFADDQGTVAGWEGFRRDWPHADWVEDPVAAGGINRSLWGRPADPDAPLKLWVRGTHFQVQVWRALLRLGGAGLTSYSELAAAIGRPGAARAVGAAVGANRLGWLIPCHRVLRSDGGLGGYRWGIERKRVMLAREYAARAAAA